MKRLFTVLTLLMCVCSLDYASNDVNLNEYKLQEYNTVEEYQEAYLNKILTYVPIETKLMSGSYVSFMRPQPGFGDELKMKQFLVTEITGKTKKNRNWQEMQWTIKEVDGFERKSFKVYSGNYPDLINIYSGTEFHLKDLQLFVLDSWKDDHKSEIGKVFENPLVKAQYEVIDVDLCIVKDIVEELQIVYTVQNSITGEKYNYNSRKADTQCFEDDLAGEYHPSLSRVEKPENPAVQYGKTAIIEKEGKTEFSYKDNFIDILIFCTPRQFFFTLKNVSENTLKLIWDDAVFVDNNGSTSKVIHKGTKYSDRDASQPASTIIRGASIDDEICPTNNVRWDDYLKDWRLDLIYPKDYGIDYKINTLKGSMENKQVQLMLPIQIKDVVNEYIFVFEIKYQYNHPERLNLP